MIPSMRPERLRAASWWALRLLAVMALIPLFSGASLAQTATFDSGSNGSDGALSLTTPGTYIFDPRTFNPPLDADGDNVYHFTTITIAAGVTVRLRGPELNMKPVFWLASGAVKIDGTIDLSGEAGYIVDRIPATRRPSVPGAGGYGGGVGGLFLPTLGTLSNSQPGNGPGGGLTTSGFGGGAGHFGRGGGGGAGGAAYGNDFLVPLLGGSGGAGGNGESGGGGAGGGALLIASSVSIAVDGAIRADGGQPGQGGNCSGAGSGGAIRLVAATINGAGLLSTAGTGGCAPGAPGRIRMEAFQHAFTGSTSPAPFRSTPSALFLPPGQPSVRVVSVGGAAVPDVPRASFDAPDVTINSSSAVTLNIEAHNIPPGTVIKLHVFSENVADQIVDSTPLAGTFAQSTATASVTVPSGFSRMFVRATWTP